MRRLCRHVLALKRDHASHQLLCESVFGTGLPRSPRYVLWPPISHVSLSFPQARSSTEKDGNSGSVLFLSVQGTIRAAITTAYMFPSFRLLCPVAQPEISLKTGTNTGIK